jgi:hypothetical protein
MKIAIINTMEKFDAIAGTVLSTHRTREAAEREDAAIQRAVKRHNGRGSYLPTIIREVDPKAK